MPFRLSARQRAGLAVVLLVACALGNVRFLWRLTKQHRQGLEANTFVQFMHRVEPLRDALPPHGTLGYLSQPAPDCERLLGLNRFSLLLYAVTPCWLERTQTHEYLLFDADDPQAAPPAAAEQGWTLVADAGNGLKLYRTRAAR